MPRRSGHFRLEEAEDRRLHRPPTLRIARKPASLAIVRNRQDDVLAVRRPSPPHEFAVPGGEVERGESPVEAALRELREETNIVGHTAYLVWASTSPTDGRQVYIVLVRSWSGTALPIEGADVAWMKERVLVDQAGRYANFHREMFKAVRGATSPRQQPLRGSSAASHGRRR